MTHSDVELIDAVDGAVIVKFTGEHDLTTREQTNELFETLIARHTTVTADLSDATFVDSSFIHSLVNADRSARARGTRFRVQLGTMAGVAQALEISGVLDKLEYIRPDDNSPVASPLPEDFTQTVSA